MNNVIVYWGEYDMFLTVISIDNQSVKFHNDDIGFHEVYTLKVVEAFHNGELIVIGQ